MKRIALGGESRRSPQLRFLNFTSRAGDNIFIYFFIWIVKLGQIESFFSFWGRVFLTRSFLDSSKLANSMSKVPLSPQFLHHWFLRIYPRISIDRFLRLRFGRNSKTNFSALRLISKFSFWLDFRLSLYMTFLDCCFHFVLILMTSFGTSF